MSLRILGIIRDQEADKLLLSRKDHPKFPEFLKLASEGKQRELVDGEGCVWDLVQKVVSDGILHYFCRIRREEVSSRDIVRDNARRTAIVSYSSQQGVTQK